MRHRYIVICLMLLVMTTGQGFGQTQEVKFTRISATDGLDLGKINSITQDAFGFIWMTDEDNYSVIRYDGSYMDRFVWDADDATGLGGHHPECLIAEEDGTLWIGFYGQGLDRFDPETYTFKHYRHDPDVSGSLSHDLVSAVIKDHLGNIWVGNNGGLDLLDQEADTFVHFRHDPHDPASLSCNTVRAVYEDREGTIWVGTGMSYDLIPEGGLNKLDRTSGTFTRYLHDPDDPSSLANDKVRAIYEDSQGNFWIGSMGQDGLQIMDRESGRFTRYPYDPDNPDKLSRPPLNYRIIFDHISTIVEDQQGQIWIGTVAGGTNRYDPVTKTMVHYGGNNDAYGTAVDNSAWTIVPSREGILWMSTSANRETYRIDLDLPTIPALLPALTAFCEESPNMVWMGTSNGLIRKDLLSGTEQRFVHDPENPNSLSDNSIQAILQDRAGVCWIGTTNGLNRYDPATGHFTRYLNNPADSTTLASNNVRTLFEDSDSNLWIAILGSGLDVLDKETGVFTHYQADPDDPGALEMGYVSAIIEDNQQRLWVGQLGPGALCRFNKDQDTFKRYSAISHVRGLLVDSHQDLWMATTSGLHKYNPSTDVFENTIVRDDLLSITDDAYGNIWGAFSWGILKYDPGIDQITRFGGDNGINPNLTFLTGAAYRRSDGQLLIGSSTGHYVISPDKLHIDADPAKVYITDLRLFGENSYEKEGSMTQTSLLTKESLRIPYDQNSFGLGLALVKYANARGAQIEYWLKPYDAEWRTAHSGDVINYNRVPPGHYTFELRAAEVYGGSRAEDSLEVIVLPPWWKTWWAYGLYVLVLLGAVFLVHRTLKARVIRKERERIKDRELAQAREIEKAYTELQNTQAQLVHSEKMASLGELTAGIAHEIKNPLNFVNNFSEVNTELIDELESEIEAGNLDGIKAIAEDIKANQKKIHSHGTRADAIVRSMLQHSRTSSGEKEPTDINSLCDEYLRLAYHGLRAKDKSFNAEFKTDFDETLPKVNVVPQDIGRVLLNLINNAFYACTERSRGTKTERKSLIVDRSTDNDQRSTANSSYQPLVTVSTKRQDNTAIITVSDNGPGIPDEIVDKIFQPFFTTKPTGEGTGLGLSLAYDIVTKGHSGEMRVETEEGVGTTFYIHLPMA